MAGHRQPALVGAKIILGVTGSIAAYKAVGLLRVLMHEGATVQVVMTHAATKFIAPLTFEVLSGRAVSIDLFEAHHEMKHLSMPEQADLILVAPATANFLAKAASGLADDLLSTMLLTAHCPLLVAPAMDGGMWSHSAVAQNVQTLRTRGVIVLDPDEGPLASGRFGQGRLADESRIVESIETALFPQRDWQGHRILVSAGPTQEPIDPVRFISNRSSGKMGYALAEAARARGAEVTLISGPTALPVPAGVEIVEVKTAEEMTKAMCSRLSWSTVVVMAAAVADYRPAETSVHKLKKQGRGEQALRLEPTVDILATLSAQRTNQLLIGFAAETQDLIAHATRKLSAKGLDLIVANDVTREGAGFGSDQNAATVIDRQGRTTEFPLMAKRRLADHILNVARALILPHGPQAGIRTD